MIKSTQKNSLVKEDCVIEDSTGTIMAHIWEPLIDQLKDGQAYLFKNLTIKNFQGCTFVSTSPQTTISSITQTLTDLAGPDILNSPDQQVTIPSIKLVNKLSVYASCQVCKKRINDLSSSSIKCQQCGTRQRISNSTRDASARFCITDNNEKDIWLNVFTCELSQLLQKSSVTIQSTVDEIEEVLMSLEDITLTYNLQTNKLTQILSFEDPSAKDNL